MKRDDYSYAFTGRFNVFRGRIVSDILLCSPDEGNPNSIRIRAMWDTGCCTSIISRRAAEFLRLKLGRERSFRTPFGGSFLQSMAEARICVVLGGVRIPLEVGVADKPNSDIVCDMTLGLDFISRGDFAITHDAGNLFLSFCYPPVGVPTDFTLIAPRFSSDKVVVDDVDIDESDSVESSCRSLIMADYYKEAAKAGNEEQS